MANLEQLQENLRARGFECSCFATAREAADYLDAKIDGCTVGMGGSMTIQQLGLMERLAAHNDFRSHWTGGTWADCEGTQVYLCSVNGLAETGEIINIDGSGNRVDATIYGHQELYLVVGINKIAPDYESALWRARNIAAPRNAQRLGVDTPCAKKGDRCYDCSSPQRICRALTVLWEKPRAIGRAEVVLVGEELGL